MLIKSILLRTIHFIHFIPIRWICIGIIPSMIQCSNQVLLCVNVYFFIEYAISFQKAAYSCHQIKPIYMQSFSTNTNKQLKLSSILHIRLIFMPFGIDLSILIRLLSIRPSLLPPSHIKYVSMVYGDGAHEPKLQLYISKT